ncbi:bifunctional [glutamine synthetase] adenylyltransferase/[glutamine synthetase]-adenylyl-L-tyrosine phosphorylase [Acetobacter peroxydans]|jgi:glutamate-ammonia-ligase adenylyltransferase|uniref:bifunctional [glutamine synthetase] adenylyltransferase/[glutamine synthetase]-adenylyl-L-tyrosine phosphorylase n=1 Tax=Acetobacter peroxydans TaxID=104098 RepID=UPI00235571C6|nr:bifunctional [glutamine synthetase] adenylyltransferase/[glutamine synthetase]-adenylyl-L-tyrosine phosphorylase [Acetobacter peroxydans]MCH4142416.1 bifunctional [glutamine synthetase] adenylyltransferase/[glutamine synthetase]-adenylyl-L-tyrosine phosphorylase [Acetobacter peroxydans]MCI1394503.1 bifunctional [glutamine synthetase] adenylyltransferase/[glutamine synthetase]-adenylyl-L-tyrosine phosphorylase [Acetobacter peroxydans]MCI1410302.1 bifunctional [glutamine synthetase] adenylyltra
MTQAKQFLFRDVRLPRAQSLRTWPGADWPRPASPAAAQAFAEDMLALATQAGLPVHSLEQPGAVALLACLGGNSPYLSDLAREDVGAFIALLEQGPERCAEEAFAACEMFDTTLGRENVAAFLRKIKKRVAFLCAVADLGGFWPLEDVTATLSRLAETTLDLAVRHLLWSAHQAGQIELPHPERPTQGCGLVVLAMGKLGARELNFSSDIDLVVLYDPAVYSQPDTARRVFVRMTSDLVSLMEARDANGYVFRTDLRLRPDPSSTPPAVTVQAAILYYESLGQTWERAAMIKARPVAGDMTAGRRFMAAIRPFIWRRHLDFTLIDDIHDMKARIDRYRKAGRTDLAQLPDAVLADPAASRAWLLGHNVKLGQGGIREIEFIVQAIQLVWGGREPGLRERTTFGALKKLVGSGRLPREEAEILARTYRFLRDAEHRLQMRADQQTHSLPDTEEGFEAFAVFMNYPDGEALALDMLPRMREARRIFERHFVIQPPEQGGEAGSVLVPVPEEGGAEGSQMAELLARHGFPESEIAEASQVLARWSGSGLRALRSERAHALLRAQLSSFLASFGKRSSPLACLRRFDALLARQHAGVQLLSLFERNPELIDRIASIFDASAFLADHLADTPSALEGLLDSDPEENRGVVDRLLHLAEEAEDVEGLLSVLRPLLRGEEFRLSVALLEGRLSEDAAEHARTLLADTIMIVLRKAVERDHIRRYGRVPGGGMAVVALGKAGSREMMPGSDLDLLMVYSHPPDSQASVVPARGQGRARSLAVGAYYTRLAHTFIAALTAPGPEGPLYAVDMRLRPSGAAGPVAVSREAFLRYHAETAWTWESMALTRARVVSAPVALARVLRADLACILDGSIRSERVARVTLLADANAMRARLARELPPTSVWDVKRRAGGLMEVEFIAQILQLCAGRAAARSTETRLALGRLVRVGELTEQDGAVLIEAESFWRRLQALLRLLCGPVPPQNLEEDLASTALDVLLRGMSVSDLAALIEQANTLAYAVEQCFARLVGPLDPA